MAKAKYPLTLGEEIWGDRVRRAYQKSKREFGHTWEELAKRITNAGWYQTHTTLMDLMRYEDKPGRTAALQRAWLLSLALGIDPAEFDLYPEDVQSEELASKRVADLLKPRNPCLVISAA